jgi:beta-N-acetylhexosaminidase
MTKEPLYKLAVAILIAAAIAGNQPGSASQRRQSERRPGRSSQTSWVEKTLAGMTVDEKIGQMLMPAVVGTFIGQDSERFQEIRRNITEYHVGGYLMLGEVEVIHEPAGVALLINHMQELAKHPLLISADLEGGAGLRFSGATRLPRGMAIGATDSEEMAYQAGRVTAEEARAIGVTVNFYPVADVNNNPANPVINIRSFGGDPELVSRLARAYIRGSQEAGVVATAKHFPGHGDTSVDSHLELPVVDADRERLDQVELPPFKAAVAENVGAVMTAHIALPQIDSAGLPATLSTKILTGLLREELGFKGITFTDAMNMQGVAAHYPPGEAAVRAVKAGADVVLMPPDLPAAFTGLKNAIASGEITEQRVNDSVRAILAAKTRLGIDKNRFTDIKNLDRVLGSAANQLTARRVIESAITLVKDDNRVLPLRPSEEQKILFISMVDRNEGWRDGKPGRVFLAGLNKRHPRVTDVFVSDRSSPAELQLVAKLAAMADAVIICAFISIAAFKGSIDLGENQLALLRQISTFRKPVAFVMHGNPYLLRAVPELPTYVLAYEYYPGAEEAALRAVLGEIEFRGRLPIELPGLERRRR